MRNCSFGLIALLLLSPNVFADEILFQDYFQNKLAEGWNWVRENPEGWRTTEEGLEILVEPGNMWGGENNARNVLVRPLPEFESGKLSIEVQVENDPTHQYEQVNLVWYADDSNMVKIGLELVHGQLSLVMGREEQDKPRTIIIIPMESTKVALLLTVDGENIQGHYRGDETADWDLAGECDLPKHAKASISLQAYQGAKDVAHWAKIKNFKIERVKD